ncbi:hypothetical protein GPAL_3584 [Glaciecola pallidula DSM 14239 = ACAM 615]|uniref:Uncharacterized protein n=1 Tax=Brumicola pallidula DSM 14239 = ACAM 615 TaxID=1121922 RepID=K6Z2J6_9ALTE|nr:hypothetical protein GPAL_3584 [Glaciecola pallidula DSM 14239 = ACAM 615]
MLRFLPKAEKQALLNPFNSKMATFTQGLKEDGKFDLKSIQTRHFICNNYAICINDKVK